jgi:tRNA pseudouridine65 synthase
LSHADATSRGSPEPPLVVLHVDSAIVAVHKPSGVAVHRTPGCDEKPLMQRVRDLLGEAVFPAHRLDRGTSGVVVFARDVDGARALGAAFSGGRVEKRYAALVRGWAPDHALVDTPLRDETSDVLREARTELWRIARYELPVPSGRHSSTRWSWVELRPETGRTHQLRRHLAHLRHPILGDVRHGDGAQNRLLREQYAAHRLALAATRLALPHPLTQEELVVECPLAPELAGLREALEERRVR